MKLPILAYGHSILKKTANPIDEDYPELAQLIADLWETMENAHGCGLAAPQIGRAIRLFVVDSRSTYDQLGEADRAFYFDPEDQGIRETFINARIIDYSEEQWDDDEGCLSIPGITRKVSRPWSITIEYMDADFSPQSKTYSGLTARMIQHEYDHTEGILFLDHLSSFSRKRLESRLRKIAKGQVRASYPMKLTR